MLCALFELLLSLSMLTLSLLLSCMVAPPKQVETSNCSSASGRGSKLRDCRMLFAVIDVKRTQAGEGGGVGGSLPQD